MGLLHLAQEAPEVSPETSVMEAVRMMTTRRVGAIVVATGGRVVGVFTERDLMRRVVYERRDPDTTFLRSVMSSPVQVVSDSTSPTEAAALMRTHHFRHLVLVDDSGALLGMVGLRYLLYDLMDDLERKVDGLQSYIMADGPGG